VLLDVERSATWRAQSVSFVPQFTFSISRPVSTIDSSGELTAASAEGMCLVVAFAEGGRSLRWSES